MEKAYKLVAIKENISNNEAKSLIDAGLVSVGGKKLVLARQMFNSDTNFKIIKISEPKIIFEDEEIIAVNKPAFLTSENISIKYKAELINRLDKETSGVLLLAKNNKFKMLCIEEFKKSNVKKRYIAMVRGVVSEEITIDDPILTIKSKVGAFSKVDPKGKRALTKLYPLMIVGKKSIVMVEIMTGRTHQIRVHLSSIGYGIIGDQKYAKSSANRVFLHSYQTQIFGYNFIAPMDESFCEYGFEVPKKFNF